jgi:hypothetical protein
VECYIFDMTAPFQANASLFDASALLAGLLLRGRAR